MTECACGTIWCRLDWLLRCRVQWICDEHDHDITS